MVGWNVGVGGFLGLVIYRKNYGGNCNVKERAFVDR